MLLTIYCSVALHLYKLFAMNYENIRVEHEAGIAIVTINRPAKLNALNISTISELSEALQTAENDPGTRVVILTGEGNKAFAAGADVSEFAHFGKAQGKELSAGGHAKLFDYIPYMGTPVIAAINGYALGGGLELAMSCHMRLASSKAVMGLPEVSLGVIPGYGGTQRLPQLVGRGLAMEMILSAKKIDAEEALRVRLVNHVVAPEELLSACKELAMRIMRNSATAIAQAIRAINAGKAPLISGHAAEIESFAACFDSTDFKEGTSAFLEKRKPNFSDH
jgi:enoyl-CoA hydratase